MVNLVRTMDYMIRIDRSIGEMIAVFVDGNNKFGGSHFRNSITTGDYETYLVKDLINHIDASYRTIVHHNSRGITGFSDGGDDSMTLAMKFPNIFSVVVGQAIAGSFDNDVVKQAVLDTANVKDDWNEFVKLPVLTRWVLSWAAAVAPNPNKPQYFTFFSFPRVFRPPQG